MLGFIVGAVAGALAATYWSGEAGNLRDRHLPRLRSQAADKVKAAERTIVRLVENASTTACASLKGESAQKGKHTSTS
jgi:gas vesicle protein